MSQFDYTQTELLLAWKTRCNGQIIYIFGRFSVLFNTSKLIYFKYNKLQLQR